MTQSVGVRLVLLLLIAGCGQAIPPTRHYRLQPPPRQLAASELPACLVASPPSLAIDDLDVDAVYDDRRIAYRESTYRLQHYYYHRWGADPGRLVGDAFRQAYAHTGLFDRVTRRWDSRSDAVLHGRVALEEVDATPERWLGRLDLELVLVDAATERLLWTESFTTSHALSERSPNGLAAAISTGVAEIAADSAPAIASAIAAEGCAAEPEP